MSKTMNLGKLLKKTTSTLLNEHHFSFQNSTTLVKYHKHILHIINLDKGSAGINCDIALLPLYIPHQNLTLDLGMRLSKFASNNNWYYGENEQEEINSISEMLGIIESNVLPWFDEYGTPEGVLELLNKESIVGMPPFLKFKYACITELFFGNKDLAITKFEMMKKSLTSYFPDFSKLHISQTETILLEGSRASFSDYEKHNFDILKLKI